jgi:hypothetical protein
MAALLGVAAGLRAASNGTGDYGNIVCSQWFCDDASRSLHAIAEGDVAAFFRYQPAMGLVLAALALWLVAILWTRALLAGHPEEPLAAVLAVAAIAVAAGRRAVPAGILLALAIATKEWALLTAPAVLFAAGADEWRRAAVPAVIGVVLLSGVMAVGNPSSFRSAHEGQRPVDQHKLTPATLWFRVGEKQVVGRSGDRVFYEIYPPRLIGRWCRPFVILFALVASLLFWRRRGFDAAGAFALAAFVLLARALLDTQTVSYHLIPMLIAVGAWEVFARKRFPVVTVAATIAMQFTMRAVLSASESSFNAFNASYLAWTLPLFVYLGIETFRRPALPSRPQTRERRRAARPC